MKKMLDDFSATNSATASYPNPLYNTTFHSKDKSKNFSVRELFKVEYNPTNELRLKVLSHSLRVWDIMTCSVLHSILLLMELQIRH